MGKTIVCEGIFGKTHSRDLYTIYEPDGSSEKNGLLRFPPGVYIYIYMYV